MWPLLISDPESSTKPFILHLFFWLGQESEDSAKVMIILRLVGLWLPSFGKPSAVDNKKLAIWMCVFIPRMHGDFGKHCLKWSVSAESHPSVKAVFYISIWCLPALLCCTIFAPIQISGFTKSFSLKDNLYLLVLQQNSYYLSSKKLLGNHGPQVGNFPSLAQCLYCSARNAVVVLTLQWLGRTLLWSTTWSQTPSDLPCRVPPTASLRDGRQSELYNKICLKMSWEQVLWREKHSRASENLILWEKISQGYNRAI